MWRLAVYARKGLDAGHGDPNERETYPVLLADMEDELWLVGHSRLDDDPAPKFDYEPVQKMKDMKALETYHRQLIEEIRRRLIGECQERTLKCLEILTEEEIWHRPNEHSNSVGNLVLHLCGNVRQWLFSTLGGQKDIRERQKEFDEQGPLPKAQLKSMLVDLMQAADQILADCPPEQLLRRYNVQGFQENGVAILIHVTEHFSYHVGQMTYFLKAHRDMDAGYYAGQDLNQTN